MHNQAATQPSGQVQRTALQGLLGDTTAVHLALVHVDTMHTPP